MDFYRRLAESCRQSCRLTREDYLSAGIDRGLRNINGQGILAGITCISKNYGSRNGQPCEGSIFYRGKNLQDLAGDPRSSYERTVYLLLTGKLPDPEQEGELQSAFRQIRRRKRDVLETLIQREAGGTNIMNMMARCVLALYDYDSSADDTTWENMVRQVVEMIALMPILSSNLYLRKNMAPGETFRLCMDEDMLCAESILRIIRGKEGFTPLQVKALDKCLTLHAELGGGNNSAFTTRLVSSTGTDTYSAIASAICSIKGPKHGGANGKVHAMFREMKKSLEDWGNPEEVKRYLSAVLRKEAFDKSGLIYGVGHAVFTVSDPRAEIMRELAGDLAIHTGREKEFLLYRLVERLSPEIIREEKKSDKLYCANVDFYSGFIYDLLGIPEELFTPMFVNARIAGWSAHRLEEMHSGARIMHPAFPYVPGKP